MVAVMAYTCFGFLICISDDPLNAVVYLAKDHGTMCWSGVHWIASFWAAISLLAIFSTATGISIERITRDRMVSPLSHFALPRSAAVVALAAISVSMEGEVERAMRWNAAFPGENTFPHASLVIHDIFILSVISCLLVYHMRYNLFIFSINKTISIIC